MFASNSFDQTGQMRASSLCDVIEASGRSSLTNCWLRPWDRAVFVLSRMCGRSNTASVSAGSHLILFELNVLIPVMQTVKSGIGKVPLESSSKTGQNICAKWHLLRNVKEYKSHLLLANQTTNDTVILQPEKTGIVWIPLCLSHGASFDPKNSFWEGSDFWHCWLEPKARSKRSALRL